MSHYHPLPANWIVGPAEKNLGEMQNGPRMPKGELSYPLIRFLCLARLV